MLFIKYSYHIFIISYYRLLSPAQTHKTWTCPKSYARKQKRVFFSEYSVQSGTLICTKDAFFIFIL